MRTVCGLIALALLVPVGHRAAAAAEPASSKPRLLVTTDVGGDPDDQQSLVRLMLYTCDFDIEGLVASASGTPGELKREVVQPELIRDVIEAYGQVLTNLLLHRDDFPPPQQLLGVVKSGNARRGVQHVGEGHDTEGSRWIIERADRDDPRPLNVAIWGGQTDLAQALWRMRGDRGAEGLKRFTAKLRVYDIDDQDKIQPWIFENFPDLFYVLAKAPPGTDKRLGAYRGMYLGGDETLTGRAWIDANVRTAHGPLGALYPPKTWTAPNPHSTKEGDTPSWLHFLPTGLSDPAHPDWGGWGGRFRGAGRGGLFVDAEDAVGDRRDARAAVWRWRPAFQNDFAARMDWCVRPRDQANHPPAVVLNGDGSGEVLTVDAAPGERVTLSAGGTSDVDGQPLHYRWFHYAEPGTLAREDVTLIGAADASAAVTSAKAGDAHVVLEVTDTVPRR